MSRERALLGKDVYIECANCGKPIQRPEKDSYPDSVKWVHVLSPVGPGNRWCRMGEPRTVAAR